MLFDKTLSSDELARFDCTRWSRGFLPLAFFFAIFDSPLNGAKISVETAVWFDLCRVVLIPDCPARIQR